MRCGLLCIKCNLTTHTKYTSSESDPKFNPHINLRCPERIIMFTNGLIHMLNVRLDSHKPQKICSNSLDISYINNCDRHPSIAIDEHAAGEAIINVAADEKSPSPDNEKRSADNGADGGTVTTSTTTITRHGCEVSTKSSVDIVAQIIADFAECETAECPSQQDAIKKCEENGKWLPKKYFEELQITCGGGGVSSLSSVTVVGSIANNSNKTTISSSTVAVPSTTLPATSSNRLRLLSHRSSRTTTTTTTTLSQVHDVLSSADSTPSTSPAKIAADKAAANAYEFSEDSDKYEKISIFRKRRLADKKYEFSEDNAENIIPFTKLRLRAGNNGDHKRLKFLQSTGGHCSSALGGGGGGGVGGGIGIIGGVGNTSGTTTSVSNDLLLQHTHRASPSHGFRSPCGSPVGNRFMSPPGGSARSAYGKSPTYLKPYASPRSSQFNTKRTIYDLSDSLMLSGGGNSMLLLSPRGGNDDFEIFKCQQIPSVGGGGGGGGVCGVQPLSEVKPSNIDTSIVSVNASAAVTTNEKTTSKDGDNENKPKCSKKLVRRFVEEDDSTSVITSEEGLFFFKPLPIFSEAL